MFQWLIYLINNEPSFSCALFCKYSLWRCVFFFETLKWRIPPKIHVDHESFNKWKSYYWKLRSTYTSNYMMSFGSLYDLLNGVFWNLPCNVHTFFSKMKKGVFFLWFFAILLFHIRSYQKCNTRSLKSSLFENA